MSRKTKVRIVGEPLLADKIMEVIVDHFELAEDTQRFDHAIGRDYAHSKAEGVTLYLVVNKPKEEA